LMVSVGVTSYLSEAQNWPYVVSRASSVKT